jgi:hypothetical protein
LLGIFQETVSWFTPAVAVGAFGVAGTVVAVTDAEAAEAEDVPNALVAVTVKVYEVALDSPVTTIGEEEPVAVCPPEDVTVYDVAAGDPDGKENATDTAPLLKARLVPTSVPTTLIGASGGIKSFCARDFLPALLFCAIV